jgi:hypothetical protein
MKDRRGRQLGYSPGKTRSLTHQVGEWSWNTHHLHKRIQQQDDNQCWTWVGSQTPHGNIFGAYKNGRPQMTQSNRLLYMEQTGEPATAVSVHMACGNRHCSNPSHFEIVVENRPDRPQYWQLTISYELHSQLTDREKTDLSLLCKEFALRSGADFDCEYKWMTVSAQNLFLAKIKYPHAVSLLAARLCTAEELQ